MRAPARGVLKAFSFGPPSARFGAQVSAPPFVWARGLLRREPSADRAESLTRARKESRMSKPLSASEVAEEILHSVLASPRRERHLLSRTLWRKFGFRVRTEKRIQQVSEAL